MNQELKTKSKANFYLILDIMPGSTHNEILHAYNRAKTTYSSGSLAAYSLMEDESSSSIMEDIERAFVVLGNPSKRREYDIEMGFSSWIEEDERAPSASNVTPLNPAKVPAPKVSSPKSPLAPTENKPSRADVPSKPVLQMKPAARDTRPGSVEFDPNPDFEKRIAECKEIDGAFLKAVRIYRCYTPDSLAQRCKLSPSHILTIENEDTVGLHQPVYLRGHVYLICQSLELPNPDKLAKGFVERMMPAGKVPKRTF